MPSLDDIPDHLLHTDKKDDFLVWLTAHKIDMPTARRLAYLWGAFTQTDLNRVDYELIERRING